MQRQPSHPSSSWRAPSRKIEIPSPNQLPDGPVTFRLSNGTSVVFEESRLSPVVAVQAWIRAGAGDEPQSLAGIAHVVEHMLFKGTARRGVGQVAREVEAAGGEINAWTSHDETAVHVVLPRSAIALGIDVIADVLQNSRFDATEFSRERQVVLEEVGQGFDDPDRMAGTDLFAAVYDVHPYGRAVIGQVATVAALTRADLVRFYRRNYGARNLTLVVTGDFDPIAVRRQIERAFGRMRPGQAPLARIAQPVQRRCRVIAVRRDVKESQLLLAFRGTRVDDDDIVALDLLAVALGQGESSRLHLALVRGRELLHGASAYLFTGRDPGLFVVTGSLVSGKPRAAGRALRALLDELERVCDHEISSEELARSRTLLESQRVFDRESTQGMARKLGFFASTVGDARFETRYLERLGAVSASEVLRVARAYLDPRALTVFAQLEGGAPIRAESTPKPFAGRDVTISRDLRRVALRFRESDEAGRGKGVEPAQPARARGSAKQARAGHAPDVTVTRLASGTQLLVLRDASLPMVALRAAWVGGLRYEDASSNGASSLIASLLTRGTENHDAEAIARQVEGMAGSLSGHAGRNSLGLEAEFLTKHLEPGLELFAECLAHSTFPDRELDHERRQAHEALRQQQDDVATVAFRLFERTLYGEHPYALDPIGNARALSSLSRARVRRFFRDRYHPERVTIAAVGDVDPAALARRLTDLLPGKSGRAAPPAPDPTLSRLDGGRLAMVPLEREQAHLVLGFPGVTLRDPDRFALEMLAQILSGQGGRLFSEIREKRGLVYNIGAFSMEGLDPGYFAVHAASGPTRIATVLTHVRAELSRICREGIRATELVNVRRHLTGGHAIGLQRRSALAATLALHEAYGLGWSAYREYRERLERVQVADLQRVAQKYWDPRKEVVCVVGPKEALATISDLKAHPPSPRKRR